KSLINAGTLEMIARDGRVLWSESFNTDDLKKWQKRIQKAKSQTSEEKQKVNKLFFNSGIALTGLSSEFLSKIDMSFRFCLGQRDSKAHSMICTPRHAVIQKDGELSLGRIVEESEARILVNREVVPLAGEKNVETGQVFSFFSETSTGLSYEFLTEALPVQIFDIFKDADGSILVSGTDPVPLGAGIYEGKNDEENFWNNWGWQQTIGDLRSYWQMEVPENKELTFPGRTGGVFRLRLDYKEVPSFTQRVWVSRYDTKMTYQDKRVLHLYHSKKQNIQVANPQEIVPNPVGAGEVVWNFPTPHTLAYNHASLGILEDAKSTKGSYEVYRGYSSELSGRFTAAVDKNLQSILLGEVSYNKWFQNIWGFEKDSWSNLRFGLSAKYFNSLNSVSVAEGETGPVKAGISLMAVNLKYRFNPGLWGRDETWGLLGGYEFISIGAIQAPILGTGFFWARSMPKVFDDLISYIPYMKYPKFVDMEVTYLPASLDSNITLGSSYIINFHGKILWTQSLFGEAGFGLQSYSLEDKGQELRAGLSSFYLTVGLGLNF
ncbi:MAG: hypothetical protein ACXVCE_08120, partial [Bacteriovorax sp.]